MHLKTLNKPSLEYLLKFNYAKYLSQHSFDRHYIITYNQDNVFNTYTFEKNELLGIGDGKYNLIDTQIGCVMNIKYERIFDSPYLTSPMCPANKFYPRLKNYTIGPFYTQFDDTNTPLQQVLYTNIHNKSGFKTLNFYPYTKFLVNNIAVPFFK